MKQWRWRDHSDSSIDSKILLSRRKAIFNIWTLDVIGWEKVDGAKSGKILVVLTFTIPVLISTRSFWYRWVNDRTSHSEIDRELDVSE